MGKKNKKKKSLTPATEAHAKIMELKAKEGTHEVITPIGTVKAVSKNCNGPRGKEIRATFYFDDVRIPKMALKTLLDHAGRSNGETPKTRKVQITNDFKKWSAKHADMVAELLGSDTPEPEEAIFSAEQLSTKVKLKAFKKAIKKCNGMFDKESAKSITAGAFGDKQKTTIEKIVKAMGDTPTVDMKAALDPLL